MQFFCATGHISASQLCYEHDVCLSVCLSVTLVNSYTVQQKVEIGTRQAGRHLGYLYAEADVDSSILLFGVWSIALGRHPTARMSHYLSIC